MLSKERFCEILRTLQATTELSEKIDDLYREGLENPYCKNYNFGSLEINHEYLVIELLQYLLEDKDKIIEYFVYELDFGKKYYSSCLVVEGKNQDISTPEKLYDFLINEKNTEKP